MVGGLAFSQVITLFVTPVFYTYMDTFSHWAGAKLSRFGKKRDADHVAVPGGVLASHGVAKSSGDAAD